MMPYEGLIEALRARARQLGYALAVHGSLKRDIDLVAIPWTEDAVPEPELAESLRIAACGHYSWSMKGQDFTLAGCPGNKPHGRLGWVINLDGRPYIDLSVMPRTRKD